MTRCEENAEISDPLRETISKYNAKKLSRESSICILKKISDGFQIDENLIWWWSSEGVNKTIAPSTEIHEILRKLFSPEDEIIFVPTDDEPHPWQAYALKIELLETILLNEAFFEYIVTDGQGRIAVFETHHGDCITLKK